MALEDIENVGIDRVLSAEDTGTPLSSDVLLAFRVTGGIPQEAKHYTIEALITALGKVATDAEAGAVEAKEAIEVLKTQIQGIYDDAVAAIGNSDATGLRGQAITAIGAKQTSAIEAVDDAKSAALSAIGETDTAGARGDALEAIAAKETQVNSDLDSKLASANSTIDGKVSAAEESASAAAVSASDASDSAELAEKWASNPEDTPVTGEGENAEYSSKHWAQKAMDAANSPLASESSAGRIRATSNASYVRPEGMTEPVAYTIEAVNSIKTALQTSITTLEGKFAFVDSTYEAVITPGTEQTA